ncbi:pyruvate oxidase [Priestia megaterium]|uniref:pyruvate oxidase n=1 Tax=Priestia megaterium TaxID=1404 RepID=UPI000BFC65A2|nr:pyruvate oxidase [Priestia megaterium]MBG9471691.1 pyruvate oxidase [Priestia megaterium]PGN06343.1 pyruvate oxidase [Priestia megaterium]PGR26867.1 pyruvate oxidase [Priestia megaterium]WPL42892.1 pyruvate oxidase [Priestia megaterium]
MIKTTAGKAAMSVLKEWNIDHIFGMPGDSINHFMDNLRSEKDEIEFIQVRHEEVGALAASSYAKITGKIGVCLSIGGPGAIHLLNGLYDAKADGAPVLVLAGQVPRAKLGNESFQEVNLERVFDDVSVFNHRVDSPESFPHLLQQAIRTAYAKKGVAVLVIPDDIPSSTIKIDEKTPIANVSKTISHSDPEDIAKALLAIKYAKKPVILAGTGAKHAKLELAQFAEKIAAPVIFTLPAKGILPDHHPYNLGQLGQLGTKPAYEAMEETDLLIMIGTSYPYREFLPDGAEAIQLDSDATQIGRRYPVSIGLVGDSKTTLSQLTHNLDYQENRRFLEECQVNMENWWKHVEKEENEVSTPIKPQQVIPKLQKIVDDDAIVSVDVGNVTVWMARHFRMTNQKFVISSWLATMGCGLPAAIAGKLAHPEKQSVAVCGDGGFTMVMQDFVTAVKYKLPIVVVVLNNSEIGMIKYEQAIQGHLDYQTQLGEMNFAKFAESCGGIGYRVEKHEELETAFEKAALATVPVVIDVVVADEPPLPGKISFGQAANYSKHIMKKFFKEHELEMPPLRKGLSRML